MKKFNHLNVPDWWEPYWSKYPQGYTIVEAIINWVSQVDDMVDSQNDLTDKIVQFRGDLDSFLLRFDEELSDTVAEIISEWQDSGLLEDIISDALQTEIDDVRATREEVFNLVEYVENDLVVELQELINLAKLNGFYKIVLPSGSYDLKDNTITIPSNTVLIGSNTLFTSNVQRTRPAFVIEGDNIVLRGIRIDLNQADNGSSLAQPQTGIIVERNSKHITIENCSVRRGYAGFWVHPIYRGQMYDITIKDCIFEQLNHPIYLGLNTTDTEQRTDYIDNVRVLNNIIRNGYANSDGVKTIQNVKNVTIDGNLIDGMLRDGLDLYTSGENVIVTNNIIRNSEHQGLDIKDSFTSPYPPTTFGYNRNMLIANNIIENNFYGIGISGTVYGISIADNIIRGNRVRGISLHGRHVSITGNQVYNNCLTPGDTSGGIHLYSESWGITKNIAIVGNTVYNNGLPTNECYGIKIASASENVVISDNTINNDTELPNPHQNVGLFIIGTAKQIQCGKNTISGHSRNVWIKNGAGVSGTTVLVSLKGETNPSAAYNVNNVLLTGNNRRSVIDISVINGNEVPAGSTYLNYRLRRAKDGVLNTTSISSANTQNGAPAYTPITLNVFGDGDLTTDPRQLKSGEALVMNVQSVGAIPVTDLVAEINYLEY